MGSNALITGAAFLPFHLADIGDEEIAAVTETLRSGWLTTGARAREFEDAFAAFVGARHAVAVSSATAALHLALEAVGIKDGDEVVVPTMTFAASAEVVTYLRARPVLADCDPATLTLRAEDVERVLTPRTRAVMPVHFAGHPCDLRPILELAGARGLLVVDDAAHALPAAYQGRPIGSIADLTAFSFYATKTLTTGEGGMLTTGSDEFADRVRLMSLHGMSRQAWNRYTAAGSWRYDILEPGYKYNLSDVAASLGVVQLRRQQAFLAARRRIAASYSRAFADLDALQLPVQRADIEHSWHLYPIRLVSARLRIDRDAFIAGLRERGIGTSVHFVALHLHPYYRSTFGYRPSDFPNASDSSDRLISLPIYPRMTDGDVHRVIDAVIDLVERHRA